MLTCGIWVKRGIAKEVPDKVTLTEEDLKELLDGTEVKLRDALGEGEDLGLDDVNLPSASKEDPDEADEKQSEQQTKATSGDTDEDIIMEYGLEDYDNEGSLMTGAGMSGLMYYNNLNEDPYVDLKGIEDEEKDDDIITKEDNLYVVGKMEEECSCLEIYVYNEAEDSLYIHHDILLESFPLCLEWLSFDPSLNGKSGNYVALGTMEPDIQIWDLDIVNTIEPAYVLPGQKKKKKKKTASNKSGHTDSVLCLSWNPNAINVLASGSADKTICLWDLSKVTTVHRLSHHTDKVQSVKWHPQEPQSLLTGSFDKSVAVLDCRSPKTFKSWKLSGECEQVLWNHFSPYNFFASSDDGVVQYFDVRLDEPVFTLHAHDMATTGLSLSTQTPNCLLTVSMDKTLKAWNFTDGKPANILSRDMKLGSLNFLNNCPDSSLLFALGGEKDGLRTFDLGETNQGKQYFQNKQISTNTLETKEIDEKVTTDECTMEALSSLSLQTEHSSNENKEIVKRKKNKKKKNK